MATSTLADVPVGVDWADLVATHATLASVAAEIQNVGSAAVAIVSGGAGAPNGKSGTVLGPRERTSVNAANVWARSLDGSGAVSVTLQ
jgi:hypothetical protein